MLFRAERICNPERVRAANFFLFCQFFKAAGSAGAQQASLQTAC